MIASATRGVALDTVKATRRAWLDISANRLRSAGELASVTGRLASAAGRTSEHFLVPAPVPKDSASGVSTIRTQGVDNCVELWESDKTSGTVESLAPDNATGCVDRLPGSIRRLGNGKSGNRTADRGPSDQVSFGWCD